MIDAEELREKIANTIVATKNRSNVGTVSNYVGTPVMDAIMKTIMSELIAVKESKEWRPKEGEGYLALVNGYIRTYHAWSVKDEVYNFHASIGNCYPMDTPNELIIKEQKLIPQAMHRLKMAAKKAWFGFNGSEGPDWSDREQDKWSIQYEHARGVLVIVVTGLTQNLGRVYFPTGESCRAYIDSNKDDLELLFGVE